TKFSMPNKLFEYVMAGLAVVTSDLPDMAEIIDVHGVGATMAPTPDGIAAALASFDRDRIDRCKAHAVVAAEALCWERERERLVELVAGVS
ncbi:MAG TPA: hypothetical protein PKY13_11535, partial [Microthrixaceae bacterium]|nr:hypothetical protein [Microthrixaceae bacterium]